MESCDSPYRDSGEESRPGPHRTLDFGTDTLTGIPGRRLPTFQGQYRPSRVETGPIRAANAPRNPEKTRSLAENLDTDLPGMNSRPSRDKTTDLPGMNSRPSRDKSCPNPLRSSSLSDRKRGPTIIGTESRVKPRSARPGSPRPPGCGTVATRRGRRLPTAQMSIFPRS